MKKLLLLVSIFLLLTNSVTAQQIMCGSTFTDSGGANGSYPNSQNITYTACATNPNDLVTVTFNAFTLENNFDFLKVYDGNSANAPLLANLTGSVLPNSITSSVAGGCLYFVFTSDSSVVQAGWVATISCNPAPTCPKPTTIVSTIVNNTIELSWTENGTATQWEIELNGVGGIFTNVNPHLLTGLTPGISYTARVRAICSTNDISLWSNSFVFTSPICTQPTQLSLSNITQTSTNFSWVDNLSSSWEVAVQLASVTSTPSSGTLTTNNTNYLVSGLQQGTAYKLYVRGDCVSNNGNNWSAPFTFNTLINPPVCGGQFFDSGGISSNYQNGENYAVVILPQNPNEMVSVNFTSFQTESCCDHLQIYNGNSVLSSNLIGTYQGSISPGLITSTAVDGSLTFVWISDSSVVSTGWVADVTCSPMATCPMPNNLIVTQTTSSEANLSWNITNNAAQWEVMVTSNNNPTGQNYIVNQNSFTASNLAQGEVYIFQVRAICSATDMSNWNVFTYQLAICDVPQLVTINSVTPNTAAVSWSNNSQNSNEFEILVLPSGSPTPTATSTGGIFTFTTPFYLNGLTASTTYDVYVRAICNFNGSTDWSTAVSFTTLQYLPALVASTSLTSDQIVTTLLANNPCIDISNVTSVTGTNFGSVNGIGTFTNTNPNFPMTSGIILSSGNALNVVGPNSSFLSDGTTSWVGDSQLENIITTATGNVMNSFNATKLEFDFTTLNEFMSFNFIFASEEYGTYQCSFSDSFAFLLTDLITNTTTNIAVVPGTTIPISVVTIRDNQFNNACDSQNPAYFDVYNDVFSSATNFNGQTTIMTASSALIPNHPYHIKLVVADRQDNILDSAVFIEAGAFTAGPPQCTDKINLLAFIDSNNNGVKDGNETDFSYGSFLIDQNNSGSQTSITSPIGIYTIFDDNSANVYDLGYQINSEYAPYFSIGNVNYNDISIALGSGTQNFYFPIVQTQGFNDVTVSITSTSQPRPGFDYTNKVVYKNLGNTVTSGTLNYEKDDAVTIVSVGQNGIVANPTGFSYAFTNLQPYETRMFTVNMNVPNAPIVNIDDILSNSATISAPSNDVNINNNSFTNSQVVVASYDPNYIIESHGGRIQFNQFSSDDYLYYTIHFQNIGTANAINVRLENVLDTQLDENSIRMVSASHNYVLERIGNQLTWRFDYINLVGILQSEELSQGYVTFKIKVKPGFSVGTIIPSIAEIYFDNNPAIVTNNYNTEFFALLGTTNFGVSNVSLFPNPAQEKVTINLVNTSENLDSITLTDVLGKKIMNKKDVTSNQYILDISSLSQGMYFIELKTENNITITKKLIIE